MPTDQPDTTIACPITGNDDCRESLCQRRCYLLSLRQGGWTDEEIADLIGKSVQMSSDREQTTADPWCRTSAIATYPGFNSYLEASGKRARFVIDAKIEHASEVPKLRQYIECMGQILAMAMPRDNRDEPQFPDEGV